MTGATFHQEQADAHKLLNERQTAIAKASEIGRARADLACLQLQMPIPPWELDFDRNEVTKQVTALMKGQRFEATFYSECREVACLAFDRRLAFHTSNRHLGGRA